MAVLRERPALLVDYITILRELSGRVRDAGEFVQDPLLKGAVERYLHLAVEAIIDIGMRICSLKGLGKPERYRDLAVLLRRAGILSEEMAKELELWIGFRNILVHMYARIDPELVVDALRSIGELKNIAEELARGVESLGIDPPEAPASCREDIAKAIKEVLEKRAEVKLAYVFGSWAEGRATDRSDVDVAVYVGDRLGWRDYVALKNELEDAVGRPVDLVVLDNAPPALAYQAVARGMLIMAVDTGLMADVEAKVVKEWLDLRPRLEAYYEAVIRRLTGDQQKRIARGKSDSQYPS